MNFTIVIPAHNEQENIEATIRAVESCVRSDFEIVVVDDHSSDKTADIVRRLGGEYKNIILERNLSAPGFANALKAGFRRSGGELVLPVMADLSDDPAVIDKMYSQSKQGFDIICGSRYARGGKKVGGPWLKGLFSRFVGLSMHFLTGIPTKDVSNSFKLYRKSILDKISIETEGFEISMEIPLKAYFMGYRITEIPTTWLDRTQGSSKFNVGKQGPKYLRLYLWAIWKKLT